MGLDKKFINLFHKVSVKAALASHSFVGKKDKIAADQAAVDAMRKELNKINMKGKIVIAKHDIDSDPDFPTLNSVRGVPALYMYKDKKLVSQKVGMSNKADLVSWINQHI